MARPHCITRFAHILLLLALPIVTAGAVEAVPGPRPVQVQVSGAYQTPGWLSAESTAQLALGFDVLVPAGVPAPFAGEPAISASPSGYSLYWLIPGTPPTFLEITGEVGGVIPDYSEYDRNNQLVLNANVQGYDAYHDLTPIHDLVYWQIGNIVYSVKSQNLADTDSLTLANALVPLTHPADSDETGGEDDGADDDAAPPPETAASPELNVPNSVQSGAAISVGVEGVEGAILTVDGGFFPDSGSQRLSGVGASAVSWQAPETEPDQTVNFILSDPSNGDWLATGQTVVVGRPAEVVPLVGPAPSSDGDSLSQDGSSAQSGESTEDDHSADPHAEDSGDGAEGNENTIAGDGTGGIGSNGDDNDTFVAAELQEQQGDLTGIGSEATQPAPPTGESDGDEPSTQPAEVEEEEPRASPTASPSPTAVPRTPTPGPSPTATLAPTSGPNGMVSRVIGPAGGELTSPAGATLIIPADALNEDATVTIVPVADAKLPVVSGVNFVPGSGFDVSVAAATGQSIEQLEKPAMLRIELPPEQWRDGLTLYRIDGSEAQPLEDVTLTDAAVEAEADHFSRFVAGLPVETEPDRRNSLPFIFGALGVLVVLLLIVGYVTAQQRRRPRSITPRRSRYR